MSLIIKCMEMPQSCDTCPILKYNSSIHYCPLARTTMWGEDLAKGERSEGCPLVEVPAPHGDLIDRDYLLNSTKVPFNDIVINHWSAINAPTIIEAEE